MKLEISSWVPHLNQLIYSYFYYCKNERTTVNIVRNERVAHSGAILNIDNKRIFFDYSDAPEFIDSANLYDYYFKRSLREENHEKNIYPLNLIFHCRIRAIYW